jgi:hypothetical protein
MSKSREGDKGCTISLIGCGTSGAYALGPDDKEEEEEELSSAFMYDLLLTWFSNFFYGT